MHHVETQRETCIKCVYRILRVDSDFAFYSFVRFVLYLCLCTIMTKTSICHNFLWHVETSRLLSEFYLLLFPSLYSPIVPHFNIPSRFRVQHDDDIAYAPLCLLCTKPSHPYRIHRFNFWCANHPLLPKDFTQQRVVRRTG